MPACSRRAARGSSSSSFLRLYIVIQNAIGLSVAWAMDLHPVVGLLGGSITLTGGHGTGGAYATRFGDTMNLQGAMELTMACATAGLVMGGLSAARWRST